MDESAFVETMIHSAGTLLWIVSHPDTPNSPFRGAWLDISKRWDGSFSGCHSVELDLGTPVIATGRFAKHYSGNINLVYVFTSVGLLWIFETAASQ